MSAGSLPTGFGARIKATVHGQPGVILVRDEADARRVELSWVTHPRDRDRVGEVWVSDVDLSDIEILNAGEAL